MNEKIEHLIKKGIRFIRPETVEIGPEVDVEKFSEDGVVVHSGCRIYGNASSIGGKSVIGEEAPVTIINCQLGQGVKLKGGFFSEAVFLDGASMGSGAQVREGTILEEEARGAHTVGLKQTILFPYVTLGSLINFCDCLMSGGTGRKDHSEVGSSYIHFNYTPHQDKATPSLLGDVPRGVMLDQKPIFLGGQGGLVGPRRLAFGTVIAAGSICRKDELRPGRLIVQTTSRSMNLEFKKNHKPNLSVIIHNNFVFIANMLALLRWYHVVRKIFVTDRFSQACHEGLVVQGEKALHERLHRLKEYFLKSDSPNSGNVAMQVEDCVKSLFDFTGSPEMMGAFLEALYRSMDKHAKAYISAIKGLDEKGKSHGTAWLQEIVDVATQRLKTAHGSSQ